MPANKTYKPVRKKMPLRVPLTAEQNAAPADVTYKLQKLLAQKGLEGSSAAGVASGIPPSIAWLAYANLLLGYLS
nr:hypothetical protein [Nitrosomonas sp.]